MTTSTIAAYREDFTHRLTVAHRAPEIGDVLQYRAPGINPSPRMWVTGYDPMGVGRVAFVRFQWDVEDGSVSSCTDSTEHERSIISPECWFYISRSDEQGVHIPGSLCDYCLKAPTEDDPESAVEPLLQIHVRGKATQRTDSYCCGYCWDNGITSGGANALSEKPEHAEGSKASEANEASEAGAEAESATCPRCSNVLKSSDGDICYQCREEEVLWDDLDSHGTPISVEEALSITATVRPQPTVSDSDINNEEGTGFDPRDVAILGGNPSL